MVPALFLTCALLSDLSNPCVTFTVNCDLFPAGGTVILEAYKRQPPWPLSLPPADWTAVAVCPPSSVTWCANLTPPFWVRWETWNGGKFVDSGVRFVP